MRFVDCDLRRADFREARTRACEMRGVRLEDAHGLERLRGVAVAWSDVLDNAGAFATALGLRVIEE